MKVSMPSWSHRNVGILCVMNQTQRDWKCIIIKSKSNTIVGFFLTILKTVQTKQMEVKCRDQHCIHEDLLAT